MQSCIEPGGSIEWKISAADQPHDTRLVDGFRSGTARLCR